MQNRVLLYGKDTDICRTILLQLSARGVFCDITSLFSAAIEALEKRSYSLLIVMPEDSKEEMLYHIKLFYHASQSPILVLCDAAMADKAVFLEAGAAVCMETGEGMDTYVEQAWALIRLFSAASHAEQSKILLFAPSLVIDPTYRMVLLDGKYIDLSRREFDLLCYLAANESKTLTPEQIYGQVWSGNIECGIHDAVKSCIKTLRKKLFPYGQRYIKNVWGVGYRFTGNVDTEETL